MPMFCDGDHAGAAGVCWGGACADTIEAVSRKMLEAIAVFAIVLGFISNTSF